MPVYAGRWCSSHVLVGRMRSVLGGRVAVLLCCTSMAWPLKRVSSVTLASAPFPELPGGEGGQLSVSGRGATCPAYESGFTDPSHQGSDQRERHLRP